MLVGHMPELVILLVVLLLVVGPGKLPSVGSALGKTIREFKRESDGLTPVPQETGTPDRDRPR